MTKRVKKSRPLESMEPYKNAEQRRLEAEANEILRQAPRFKRPAKRKMPRFE